MALVVTEISRTLYTSVLQGRAKVGTLRCRVTLFWLTRFFSQAEMGKLLRT